jgi:hypothetical protein
MSSPLAKVGPTVNTNGHGGTPLWHDVEISFEQSEYAGDDES